MELFITVVKALDYPCERPTTLSSFHLFFLCLIALVTFLVIRLFRYSSYTVFRRVLLCGWLVIATLEVLRQIAYGFSYNASTNTLSFAYQWHAIPLQLCAMPHYILPLILLLPYGKLTDALTLFIGSYSFFAGLVVLCYPDTIMTTSAFINVQGMVHHGIQVILGAYVVAHEYKYFPRATFLRSTAVFIFLVAMAITLNEIGYVLWEKYDICGFNLFLIARQRLGDVEILRQLQAALPYPVFVLGYILVLLVCSYLLYTLFAYIFRKTDKQLCPKKR